MPDPINHEYAPGAQITVRPQWFEEALKVPYTEDYALVSGNRVHYLAWGDPKNRPLLMVHGNGAHAHWFHFMGALLSETYRPVSVTLSGMGDSGWRRTYTRQSMAEDIVGVADYMDLDRVCLMGHSFGGLISLVAARDLAARCAALVLADFFPRTAAQVVEWFAGEPPRRPTRVYPTHAAIMARFRLAPDQPCTNQFLLDYIAERSVRKVEGGWTWKFDPCIYQNMRVGTDQVTILQGLGCPVGLLHGAHTQEESRHIIASMPSVLPAGSPIVALPDSQHHLMLDQPLPYVAALDRMFQQLLATAP